MLRRTLMVAVALAVAGSATACGNPPAGDSAYKAGSLGNGGFVFGCNDGVACNLFSTGYASDFPKDGVALGSTFDIYYVPNDEQQGPVVFTRHEDGENITVHGITPFFTGGPEGITAGTREGYGAIVAEHSNGVVADFIDLKIVKPSKLTVYEASITSNAQDVGAAITLTVNGSRQLRTVSLDALNNVLAGSLRFAWNSSDESVFSATVSDGVATLNGLKAGTATLTITGAAFTRTIPVTVTQ